MMNIMLLVEYHDSDGQTGFHICSTRRMAKQKALEFLSRCKIEAGGGDFGDYSDWAEGAIWYATAKSLGGSVTIFEVTVDGALVGSCDYPNVPV